MQNARRRCRAWGVLPSLGRKKSGSALELALLGDALVRLVDALDPVLLLVTFSREHANHLVDASGVTAANQASDDVDIVADAELVSQESLLKRTQTNFCTAASGA